jgi:hypothetical protein
VNAKGNNVVNCQQLPGAPNSSTITHSLRLAGRLELDNPAASWDNAKMSVQEWGWFTSARF